MIDQGEADDKIISVLDNDRYYKEINELSELPDVLIERLRHYFGTYKLIPGKKENDVFVDHVFGRDEAEKVIEAAIEDYKDMFGD